jgi:hypothetical protein
MNNIAMARQNVAFELEIHDLHKPYRGPDSLQSATLVHKFESPTAFGSFQVGQTLSHMQPTKYLGTIQHIHHWIGEDDDMRLVHRTMLYVSSAPV